jgi:hypothetical protein
VRPLYNIFVKLKLIESGRLLLAALSNLGEPSSKNKTFAAFQIQEEPKNFLAGQNFKM